VTGAVRLEPGAAATATRVLRVARGAAGEPPRYQTYEIPDGERMTVLDGLLHVQRHLDRSMAFRYNCRAMMCGSCGVRVNGVERLACSTRLSAVTGRTLTIEPLRYLPVVEDVMVEFGPFVDAWRRVFPAFAPRHGDGGGVETAVPPPAPIAPDAPERQRIDPHRECISCGICYSACEVVGIAPSYLGPAAINRAVCLIHDSRDGANEKRLDALNAHGGCWRCHTHATCAEVCPKGLNPTEAIAEMKRTLARRAVMRFFGRSAG